MFFSRLRRFGLPALCAALLAACSHSAPPWQLNDVSGHLPDLQFDLTSDTGKAVTAADFRGKYVLMYFGYTHCPDVCPLTLVHLHLVMQKLGKQADMVRILFVSVDPARDTPQVLHQYVTAFDPHIVGLTGTPQQIAAMAKRYRSAFNIDAKQANGDYTVSHGSIIYVFDRHGRARLIGNSTDTPDAIAHDLQLLMRQD
ncbi:MAG TPA: SCO family protein [Rhodanobacteraceae bacterium]|nr:SCO family protein [Rhodanobacteraceae bacterium]